MWSVSAWKEASPAYNERIASDLNTRTGLANFMVNESFEIPWNVSSARITCNLQWNSETFLKSLKIPHERRFMLEGAFAKTIFQELTA